MKTAKQWCNEPIYLSPDVRERWVQAIQSDALMHAADIVRQRAELLANNNCKDTIREHYAEQEIRAAAMPNVES